MGKIYQTFARLKHLLTAGHAHGEGIHSPFLFRQISVLFREEKPYYCYAKIEKIRKSLARNKKISSTATHLSPKNAQLLFRLANDANPQTTLEIGTSLGLTTAYLASVDTRRKCHTIEPDPRLADLANQNFRKLYLSNIEQHAGRAAEILPELLPALGKIDFVHFAAAQNARETVADFNSILPFASQNAIVVFDAIHRSSEMSEIWREIKSNPAIRVSVDIFSMGIAYLNPHLQKENYKVRF